MSTSGPGDDSRGSSWDNPSWWSSQSDSSPSRPEEQPPNPWSREGSSTADPDAPGPTSAPSVTPPADPYQPAPADPYTAPAGYSKHTDMMQLMQVAVQKVTPGAGAPAGGARKQ